MNMNFEDILTLAKAGFSAEQISKIYSASAKPAAEPPKAEPPKVEEPKPEPPKVEEPKPEPPKVEENETQKMLREMLGLMKGNNINNLTQPNTEPVDPAQIMASILNP